MNEMNEMNALKDELMAMPYREWQHVPFAVNHHKWWLTVYRWGSRYLFVFESAQKRRYFFWVARGESYGRVTDAEVTTSCGDTIVDYRALFGDKPERLDAVLRLTPKHIIDRLLMLLSAIGKVR